MNAHFRKLSQAEISLFDAAARGDEDAVRNLVKDGVDINAVDAHGTTVVSSAILGGKDLDSVDTCSSSIEARRRCKILEILLGLRRLSLYVLNAPQEALHGMTPLGMAAYINWLDGVSVLLKKSSGAVSPDAMDSHGVTPLMYAARDGRTRVVECLVKNGARPDIRNINSRSAVQFALSHALPLWHCERTLRRQRSQALQSSKSIKKLRLSIRIHPSVLNSNDAPPPTFAFHQSYILQSVTTLIEAIVRSDYHSVQSLLFPNASPLPTPPPSPRSPASLLTFVNSPDVDGWSPIHHCVSVSQPSANILDALYLAGADVGLYTTVSHSSPLHCLARAASDDDSSESCFQVYSFVIHLVRDLRAPLDAVDANGDTCIHVAAERGRSFNVLLAFLDCDISRRVRDIKNAQGLTAVEVAKPELRIAFGPEDEIIRPVSSASVRTIRPSKSSMSSLSSFCETPTLGTFKLPPIKHSVTSSSADLQRTSLRIFDNLQAISEAVSDEDSADCDFLEAMLQDTMETANSLLQCFEDKIGLVRDGLQKDQSSHSIISRLVHEITTEVEKDDSSRHYEPSLSSSTSTISTISSIPLTPPHFSNKSLPLVPKTNSRLNLVTTLQPSNVPNRTPPTSPISHPSPLYPDWTLNLEQNRPPPPLPPKSSPKKPRALSFWSKLRRKNTLGQLKNSSEVNVSDIFVTPDVPRPIESPANGYLSEAGSESSFALPAPFYRANRTTAEYDTMSLISLLSTAPVPPPLTPPMSRALEKSRLLQSTPHTAKPMLPTLVTLNTVRRDLQRVSKHMSEVDQAIKVASATLAKAQQLISSVIRAKEHNLQSVQLFQALRDLTADDNEDDLWQIRPTVPDLDPFPPMPSPVDRRFPKTSFSSSSMSSAPSSPRPKSAGSSVVLQNTETDAERALRRVILRKLPERVFGLCAEAERLTTWLSCIREVLRPLRKYYRN